MFRRITPVAALLLSLASLRADDLKLSDGGSAHTSVSNGCATIWRVDDDGTLMWYLASRADGPAAVREDEGLLTAKIGARTIVYDDVVVEEADRKRAQNFRVFRALRRDACAGDRAPVSQLLRSAEVQDSIATPRAISSIRLAEWFYITVGPPSSPELIVRFAHTASSERKPPLIAQGTQVRSELDGLLFRDDGDLTLASAYPTWLIRELQKRIELKAQFGASRKAPELAAVRWVQTKKPLPLSALKEKRVVLLDFWGVWCPSCKDDIPRLKELRDQFRAEDLQVIGVHSALEAGRIDEFLRRHRYPAPIAVDGGAMEKAYAVTAWPTYVLIDKHGRVARYATALPTRAQIQDLIDQ